MPTPFFAPLFALLIASPPPLGVDTLATQPTDVGAADKTVARRAEEALAQIQMGKVDRSALTPTFNAEFTDAIVASDANFLKDRGTPKRFLFSSKNDGADTTRYVFIAVWGDGSVSYTFGIDKATDLIDALYFRPGLTSGTP